LLKGCAAVSSLLTIRNLTKTYDGKNFVLHGINMSVQQGELVAVVGPSGAGKSTLIRCINRMVEPTSGEVIFDQTNVEKASGRELRKIRARIGMIFQHYNLIARTNVKNNVLHGRLGETPFYKSILGLYSKADKLEAEELLKTVGLEGHMYQKARTLSGGQMQRVGICRALMQHPKLLLADEPIASLDPASATTVMEHIQTVTRQRGLACIVNLHQVDFAKKYATRIIGMKHGNIVFDGKAEDLTEDMISYIYEGDDNNNDSVKNAPPVDSKIESTEKTSILKAKIFFTRPQFLLATLAAIIFMSFFYLQVNPVNVFASFPSFFRFLNNNFLPPNFTGITAQLPIVRRTLLFAVVGTYISAFIAFFFGLLMARETNPFPPIRGTVRFFVSFLRNVPLLVWGTVLVFIFGIGSLLGVVTLVLATLGFLARSYADSIDEIAGTKLEALRANGAGYWQVMFHGLIPEFIPAWINWTLFSFEINIRASAILGMVGAGGLGLLIQTNLDLRSFRRAMALVLILVAMVLVTEILVNTIRKLMEKQNNVQLPPLLDKLYGVSITAMLVVIFFASARSLELNFTLFATRFMANVGTVVPRLVAFNPSALPEIFHQLFVSIIIGICALTIGTVVSMVLAFLAAGNITPWKPLSWAIKGVISVIRAVPSLVLILMVVASLGFGYTTAVVGLMFSSVGYLTKAFIASIEEQDFGIIEAMRATGANRFQVIVHGLLPSCTTAFISWISIRLESNISDSISIGIVGAGGVGMLIARANRQLNFPNLTTIILVIFAAMLVIEFGTGKLRKKLAG